MSMFIPHLELQAKRQTNSDSVTSPAPYCCPLVFHRQIMMVFLDRLIQPSYPLVKPTFYMAKLAYIHGTPILPTKDNQNLKPIKYFSKVLCTFLYIKIN